MAKNILLPLDGSAFSEQAVRFGCALAQAHGGSIHLVKVHSTPTAMVQPDGYAYFAAGVDKDLRESEARNLADTAAEVRACGVPVKTHLATGGIVEALKEYVAQEHIDLIVMTTHGRGGLSRAWLGSVADSLVRAVTVPVVLLRPRNCPPQTNCFQYPPRHILVPLDGSDLSEEIIDRALAISSPAVPQLTLLQVVPPPMEIPAAESIVAFSELDRDVKKMRESALEYLNAVARKLRKRGIAAETRVVVQSQTALAILEQSLDCGADLIAMVTHGRTGWARVALGSVADKVLRSTSVPLLLHKPGPEVVLPNVAESVAALAM